VSNIFVRITGISRTSIWRLERAGKFPQRIELIGGRVGWQSKEIKNWVNSRCTNKKPTGENTMSELLTRKEVANLFGWSDKEMTEATKNDDTFPHLLTRAGRSYLDEAAVLEWAEDNDIDIYNEDDEEE